MDDFATGYLAGQDGGNNNGGFFGNEGLWAVIILAIANKSNKVSFTIIHLVNPPTQSSHLPQQQPERIRTARWSFRAVWLHG